MNKARDPEVVMNIFFDNRLQSYSQFFDHHKAREFSALTAGTKLEDAANILCGTWKAASNTIRLPWLAAESIEKVGLGAAMDTKSKQSFLEHLPRHLRNSLPIPAELRFALETEVCRLVKAFQQAEKLTKKTFNSQLIWDSFIDTKKNDGSPVAEFPMAIWGSQQIGFGATYHAYENFLRTVIAKLLTMPDYRIDYRGKVQKDVANLLGQIICDQCIDDSKIKLAKQVRNSLAHQGGYVQVDPTTPDNYHGFRVIDSVLQVDATNNRDLFLLLQDRAHVFAEAALKKL